MKIIGPHGHLKPIAGSWKPLRLIAHAVRAYWLWLGVPVAVFLLSRRLESGLDGGIPSLFAKILLLTVAVVSGFASVWMALAFFDNFIPAKGVSGTSMSPTILDDEVVVLDRFGRVGRGDIVVLYVESAGWSNDVCRQLGVPSDKTWVKRVIGLPGDMVAVFSDGRVLVDGDNLRGEQEQIAQIEVPQGHYFMVGDNRAESYDSRHVGPLPADMILGKAICVMLPVRAMRFLK